MTTLQLRIDEKLKKQAMKIAGELGMDLSTAIKVFLSHMVAFKGIPFEIRTVNGFTPAQERKMLQETEAAKRHGKRYHSVDELITDLERDL